MRVSRSTSRRPGSETETNFQLVEQLVEKAVLVNPQVAAGRKNTTDVVRYLKESVAVGTGGRGPEPTPVPLCDETTAVTRAPVQPTPSVPAESHEGRRVAMQYYFRQKARDFRESAAEITAQIAELESRKRDLARRTRDELVDFVNLMPGGARSRDAAGVLQEFGSFLKQLGCSGGDVTSTFGNRPRAEVG